MSTDAAASRGTAAVVLNGTTMRDESGFHRNLAATLGDRLRASYGRNLDALRDIVSLEIEGPLDIHWSDHAAAREHLPPAFYAKVIEIFQKAGSG